MSHWNHRVVRRVFDDDEVVFGIHEAYYDDKGLVRAITANPAGAVSETAESLRETLQRMLKACDNPVLEYDQIPEPGAEPWN